MFFVVIAASADAVEIMDELDDFDSFAFCQSQQWQNWNGDGQISSKRELKKENVIAAQGARYPGIVIEDRNEGGKAVLWKFRSDGKRFPSTGEGNLRNIDSGFRAGVVLMF